MNDQTNIPDRLIERLRLGELDEDQAHELLKALEDRGEMHRLDALIEEDETIRAQYPPAMLASQARATVRQRARKGKPSSSESRAPYWAAAVLLVLIVAVGVFDSSSIIPTPEQATSTEPAGAKPLTRPYEGMFAELLREGRGSNLIPVYPCLTGEQLTLTDPSISRVTTDRSAAIQVGADDDGIELLCQAEHSAMVTFFRDQKPTNVSFRIGPAYQDVVPEPSCDVRDTVEARVLVDKRGISEMVVVTGSAPEGDLECVRQHFQGVSWSTNDEPWRIVSWAHRDRE